MTAKMSAEQERQKRVDAINQALEKKPRSLDELLAVLWRQDDPVLHMSRTGMNALRIEMGIDKRNGVYVSPEKNDELKIEQDLIRLLVGHTKEDCDPTWMCIPVDHGYAVPLANLIRLHGVGKPHIVGMVPAETMLLIALRSPLQKKAFLTALNKLRNKA